MQAMADTNMAMGNPSPITFAAASTYLVSWGVMMAAMMLPSAVPTIALYGAMQRNFSTTGQLGIPVALFTLVYLVVWMAFGIPIYIASVLIDVLLSGNPTLSALAPYGVALVLLVAGLFQFTPLKQACLRHCQSPLGFLMGHWRSGYRGTLMMAFKHSAYCVGCCTGLMIVLVAAGAMALHWVLLIAVAVFIEKILPRSEWTVRIVGGALIALAALIVISPPLAAVL
jgi:predicted metal-binding membrane protein